MDRQSHKTMRQKRTYSMSDCHESKKTERPFANKRERIAVSEAQRHPEQAEPCQRHPHEDE